MKIALIGYGKMGHEVETVAREQGETIVRTFDIDSPAEVSKLVDVDMCIEFSTPQTVLDNIRIAAEAGRDIVVGTTGWYHRLPEVQGWVKDSGLLYSPNFSIGVNLTFRLVAAAAELLKNSPEYDLYIHEVHHRQKADSPSGTALRLAEILMKRVQRKTKLVTGPVQGRIDPEALHVSSTRAGSFAGTHTAGFDSEADTIEITHTAKTRRGFALGAVRAARWLRGRKGIFTMDDVEL
jgi:4-hydroxy-tetrahydrodipicolinate reductase